MVAIACFGDIKEIIQDLLNMLPQPTRGYRSMKRSQPQTQSQTQPEVPAEAVEEDTRSLCSDETRIDPEELQDSEIGNREHGGAPPKYGRMPDITVCTVTFRDEKGFMYVQPIKVAVGLDHHATARNIISDMRTALQADSAALPSKRSRGTPDEFNQGDTPGTRAAAIGPASPLVVSVRCGDFSVHAEAGDANPEQATTIALHRFIRDHISVQYDSSLDALAGRDWSQAIYIALAVVRERAHAAARDLNPDFTNRALTMGIVAIATAAEGVDTLNSDSIDDQLTRMRAVDLLREAIDVVNECLQGRDGSERWISAAGRDGAGVTLRENLTVVRDMILSIQRVASDYFEQNPLG